RLHASVELGASPRATLALYRASQALAGLHGRSYVLPDDVKRLAAAVLTHRVITSAQARLRGRGAADAVTELLATVPVPVEAAAAGVDRSGRHRTRRRHAVRAGARGAVAHSGTADAQRADVGAVVRTGAAPLPPDVQRTRRARVWSSDVADGRRVRPGGAGDG